MTDICTFSKISQKLYPLRQKIKNDKKLRDIFENEEHDIFRSFKQFEKEEKQRYTLKYRVVSRMNDSAYREGLVSSRVKLFVTGTRPISTVTHTRGEHIRRLRIYDIRLRRAVAHRGR